MPSLSSFCAVENPFMPFSMMKAVMPRGPAAGIGLGIDHQRVGDRAVGDPHLAAVDDVAVALLLGAGRHRHHVGAGVRLRHRQRADMLAGNQLRQIFPLLRLVAVAADLVDAEIGMRAVGQADRRRRARDFLDRDAVLEIAEPGAAIFLLDGNAVQAERADLRPEVAGKLIALVDLGGARRDLVAGEILHGFADRVRGLAEIEIEHPMRVGNHGRAASGQIVRLVSRTALFVGNKLVTA